MAEINNRDAIIRKKILIEIDDINQFIDKMTEEEFYEDIKTQKASPMIL